MDDLISRKQALDAFGLSEKTRKYGGDHSGYETMMLYEIQDVIEGLPSVNPQASNEDIHREREQAYMRGYEDASKRYRTEPCEDAISRKDAIRIASGYCHWTNIPKELAKLPSVNPIQCEDAISRQAVLEGLARIAKAKAKSDAQKSMMGRTMFFVEQLPSVSTEKAGRWKKIKSGDKTFPESIVCSRCGWENSYISKWDRNNNPLSKTFKTTRYCPNCGAKMEAEE